MLRCIFWGLGVFTIEAFIRPNPLPQSNRDTVSSVGIVRGRNLPRTDEFNSSICYFRHALALDERRVKYLPEYVCGGESYVPSQMTERREQSHVGTIFCG
jgi:hypothetical protein